MKHEVWGFSRFKVELRAQQTNTKDWAAGHLRLLRSERPSDDRLERKSSHEA